MSYAACPLNFININQNQKEDLLRFEASAIDNFKHLKIIEFKSRIRISLIIFVISLFIFLTYKFRNNKIIIETSNNIPLIIFVSFFFFFLLKYYYKNLFKSKNYIKSLNKTLKSFNLYLDKKSLKLCIIGLKKE
ncbi:conserved Plasmodium protein, unknown function [Plasmodium gallinaceum]|uniref:Uncharacterized protein n=1 Tax=Plasmodium gallinaceum TaxID=5849 RepID=A0A1J1GLN8_PLAGA|nr:conserved Plasmodium protein, unknown function [Plasmodium gallinaceum]CRG93133.1 conserved Plasmodium protein, unknown function [Plasmodium gallinaceum]